MRAVALLLLVAATLACKPVSSEISVPTESTTTQTPPETAKPQVEALRVRSYTLPEILAVAAAGMSSWSSPVTLREPSALAPRPGA